MDLKRLLLESVMWSDDAWYGAFPAPLCDRVGQGGESASRRGDWTASVALKERVDPREKKEERQEVR